MAVNKNIPQASDMLAISQLDLLNNNIGYVDTFAVDHTDYNSVNPGFHNKVTFPGITPDPVTTGDTGVIFGKVTSAVPPRMDTYYKYQTAVSSSMSGQVFPVNFIKAFAKLRKTAPHFTVAESLNIASVTFDGSHVFTVNLITPFVDNSDKIMVFLTAESNITSVATNYTFDVGSPTSIIQVSTAIGSEFTKLSFMACSLGW